MDNDHLLQIFDRQVMQDGLVEILLHLQNGHPARAAGASAALAVSLNRFAVIVGTQCETDTEITQFAERYACGFPHRVDQYGY